ncbi:Dihydropteroate synthase-like protein [Phyllosticta capitalensis]
MSARQCLRFTHRPLHRAFSLSARQTPRLHGLHAGRNLDLSSRPRSPKVTLRNLSCASRLRSDVVENGEFDFAEEPASSSRPGQTLKKAFIALGSNMGDRIAMIEKACRAMERAGDIRILRTSSLWETAPMYVEDQDSFVNGACEIETTLEPIPLLDRLQEIEKELDRKKTIDKGPRTIDLDILLYEDQRIDEPRLTIPHPLMLEREFVLRPLCQMIPNHIYPLPDDGANTLSEHLEMLPASSEAISTMTPLSPTLPPIMALRKDRKTLGMAIINLTLDSFSDGGTFSKARPDGRPPKAPKKRDQFVLNEKAVVELAQSLMAAGCSILDLGGQSTRPNAPDIDPEAEWKRVKSAVELIRLLPSSGGIAISIDTYRASVAERAIQAGAHIVNDVSAGTMDPLMLSTVAKLGCTYCLMHMRGTPQTMGDMTDYPDGIVAGVAEELKERIRAAEAAGIKRWRIILDPGFGFAKTVEQNVELLRRFGELRAWPGLEGFAWLVGASRKSFVGKIARVSKADRRDGPTIITTAAAIQQGADIIRLHHQPSIMAPIRAADAIWRY